MSKSKSLRRLKMEKELAKKKGIAFNDTRYALYGKLRRK